MGEGPGQSYLDEREEQPHGEVGEPVDGARHDEGRRPLRLLEELAGQDEGDAACRQSRAELITPRGRPHTAIHVPAVWGGGRPLGKSQAAWVSDGCWGAGGSYSPDP